MQYKKVDWKIWFIRIVLILLILFWMSVIFGFSSEDGAQSQSLSDKITIKVIEFIKPGYDSLSVAEQKQFFDTVSFCVRKTGHFCEYGILGFLTAAFLMTFYRIRNFNKRNTVILSGAALWGLIYAATDEFHQGFVDGRSPKVMDVVIDTLGTFTGAAALVIIFCLSVYCIHKGEQMKLWEKSIRKVTPYVPGEQPKIDNVIKLNTNECPYPPSPKVNEVINKLDYDKFRLYPDPDASVLTDALADYYSVDSNQVFVGVGSDDVIGMAFLTFFNSDKPILFPDITYSFYDVWADLFKIPYETVRLNENFEINPQDFCKANGGIIFPNPNAPTAIELKADSVEEIIKRNQDSVIIVDEAYVDFGGTSALSLIDKYENLLVVRTFSKSRAMAGMRIGYAIGSEKLIGALKAVKFSYNSYTMNMPSIYAGAEAIKDDEYFKDIVSKIIATREDAKKILESMGFNCTDSKANFLFAAHKTIPAKEIFEKLKEKQIFVRYFEKPRIDNYLRITIGTDKEMEKLYQALNEIIKTR